MISRTMIIGDVHVPFHDTKSLGLVLDILEDRKLDRLVINGDFFDFYCINSHGPKHPDIQATLEYELESGREMLVNLRKRFPDLKIVFNSGNHEWRLDRFIINNCPAFWNLFTLENYIDFEGLDIEYYPYNNKYQLEKTNCFIQHSPPSYGVNGARTSLLKKLDQTYIYGCTHREQKACITAASGQVHAAYFNGWLGSATETSEHAQVFSYAKGHQDWQQCFIIATVRDETEFFINQYSIRNHSVVVDGFLFEG